MATDLTSLEEAVRYPWDGGGAGVTLVVGGILTLLSPLIIPGLLVLGYGLRVVEAVMDGRSTPPPFDDPGELFVDGIKAGIVLLGYVVVPLVVGGALLAVIAGAVGFRFAGPLTLQGGFAAGGLTLIVALLLAGLGLVVSYLAPAALVHLARTRHLSDAFLYDDLRRLVLSDGYGAAWLLALAVFAAAGVVLTVLYHAAIGVIVSGFVTFYAFVAMAHLYARGAEAAGFELDIDEEEATESDDEEPDDDEEAG